MTVTTYNGLKDAVGNWLSGTTSDTTITSMFDDFLALHEARMYYGGAAVPEIGLPEAEPLRIREMENADSAFALTATVAQPAGFISLIEATLNSPLQPLDITTEAVIESYEDQTVDSPRIIAVSGTNFRVWPDPGSGAYTATLRYFKTLTTPAADAGNTITTKYPGIYLHGLLLEAAIRKQDYDAAKGYHAMYCSAVRGANQRRNAELMHAANVRMRMRGRTP